MSRLDAFTSGEVFRADYPQIIATKREKALLHPVRLLDKGADYVAGQVLGQITTGAPAADIGKYTDYNNSGASGEDTAVCVLLDSVTSELVANASGGSLARAVFGGGVELYEDKLIDLDANAKTDLKSRSYSDATGTNFLVF